MKKVLAVMCILMFCVSCVTLQPKKSVCVGITGPSYFCEIANKYEGVTLESVSSMLEIANVIAVSKDVYSAKESLEVLIDIRTALENPVSYMFVQSNLYTLKLKYPEIFIMSEILINRELNVPRIMYKQDQDMLIYFIDKLISDMNLLTK